MEKTDCESYDWEKEVEEFEKTKAGVKGLVDSGITKVPGFFISPPEMFIGNRTSDDSEHQIQIPVIDFQGMEKEEGVRRSQIIDEIRKASETWGFFQIVNHGVPQTVMDDILESSRRFHEELPKEAKMSLYSSDGKRPVRFFSNNGDYRRSDAANWKDSFACSLIDDIIVDLDAIPSICRTEIIEYMKHMINLRNVLSQLFSEALGLSPDFLGQIECMKNEYLSYLYYPPCPEPEKTFGAAPHSDGVTFTVLVQDRRGGLQIHHQGDWVDVPPLKGALILNIGDFLQLMSNDKFKSVEHRVIVTQSGARVSVGCFFYPGSKQMLRGYGPIQELVSDTNPPLYRRVCYNEFLTYYQKRVKPEQVNKVLFDFKIMKKIC